MLTGALVEKWESEPVHSRRVRITGTELRSVPFDAKEIFGLQLTDVILRDCDLSNVAAREGLLRRVEIHDSRLLGFSLTEGSAHDLRISNSSLALSSFAFAELRNVVFERVSLAEASFMQALLEDVEFDDCKLAGTDFRGVKLKGCAIRDSTLDGVLGVESLRGVAMPWSDVLASAGAIAAALGITVESG